MKRSTLMLSAALAISPFAEAEEALRIKVYNADANSFHVNSVLISGEKESILMDTGFTRADAYRIAANVFDSGTTLKTIFISQADPDYYFGAEVLHQIFPEADVISTPEVAAKIKQKMAGKVAYWGPKMGTNAPVNPILPTPYQADTLTLEGKKIELKGTQGTLAHRPYVWIPSIKTIAGNVAVFGDLHVWTADTQTKAEQTAWKNQLNEMMALNPERVVPGHMKSGTALSSQTIIHTQKYLDQFSQEVANSSSAAELIQRMTQHYPEAELEIALHIGAKVAKGEIKW